MGILVSLIITIISIVILDALSPPFRQRKGGVHVEFIISFLASIMANIVSYYVCKWLDGGDSGN